MSLTQQLNNQKQTMKILLTTKKNQKLNKINKLTQK
jgi:hypothetical protein